MDELTARSPGGVFDDHLQQGRHGTVEEDLARNFVPEVVVLTAAGGHRGHEEVRQLAQLLRRSCPRRPSPTPQGWWPGMSRASSGPRGRGYGARVQNGADSFVIRGGRIQAQTIHYTVLPPPCPPPTAAPHPDDDVSPTPSPEV